MVTSGRRSSAITLSLNARGSCPQGSNAKKGLPLVPSLTTQVYSPRSVIGSSSQHISTGMLVLRYEKQSLSILFLRSLVAILIYVGFLFRTQYAVTFAIPNYSAITPVRG